MFSRTSGWCLVNAMLGAFACDAGHRALSPGSSEASPSVSSLDSRNEPSSNGIDSRGSAPTGYAATETPDVAHVPPSSAGPNTQDTTASGADLSEGATSSPPPVDPLPSTAVSSDSRQTTVDSSGLTPSQGVTIVGRSIYVDGRLFHIKGVNWNPVARGNVHPENLDYAGFADQDIALMKAAGINAIRTYERLEDREVLDKLHAAGIYVFSTVLGWWQDDASAVTARVNAVKDHPAILAWVLGNEWNYNQLYSEGQLSTAQVRDKLNEAAGLIKATDPDHPVATIYGELGEIEAMIGSMPDIDLWGINAYRGKDHAALFTQWAELSDKPMFLGEYGADAWDSRDGGNENLEAQAEATTALTQQMIDAYTTEGGGITSGGFIFEWADEWWKAGDPATHDNGGQAPGGGPHPDGTFNEEWWGIVDIDRNPRPAYEALKALYL